MASRKARHEIHNESGSLNAPGRPAKLGDALLALEARPAFMPWSNYSHEIHKSLENMSQVTQSQRPDRAVAYLDRLIDVARRHAKFFGSSVAKPCHVLHALLGQEFGPSVLADSGRDPYVVSAILAEDLQGSPRAEVDQAELTEKLVQAFDGLKDYFRSDLAIDLSENYQADVLEQVLQALVGMVADDLALSHALMTAAQMSGEERQKEALAEEDIDLLLSDIQQMTADQGPPATQFKQDAPAQGRAIEPEPEDGSEDAKTASQVAERTRLDQKIRGAGAKAPTQQQSKGQLAQDAAAVEQAVKLAFRSLSDEVAEGKIDPVIGREDEIARILKALQRRRKRSVILGGPAGVGKTALAEGVAIALRGQDVPPALAGRPVYELSLSALISGARYRGDFEERMTKAIDRVKAEGAIVFIDEIHTIMGLGNSISKGMDAPNILKPALARGDILLIGATTTEEMAAIFEDKALARRLDLIEIKEPDRKAMIDILERASWVYGAHHEVEIEQGLIPAIVDICADELQDRCFPDKAFDVIDRACVEAAQDKALTVDIRHIRLAAEQLGAIFPKAPSERQRASAQRAEAVIRAGVLQPEDADHLIDAVRRAILLPASYDGATLWLVSGQKPVCDAALDLLAAALEKPICKIPPDMMKTSAASFFLSQGRQGEGAIFLREVETSRDKLFHFDEGEAFHDSAVQALSNLVQNRVMQSNTGRRYATRGMHIVITCRPQIGSQMGFGAKPMSELPAALHPLRQAADIHCLMLQDIHQPDAFDRSFDQLYTLLQASSLSLPSRDDLRQLVDASFDREGRASGGGLEPTRDDLLREMMRHAAF